MLRQMRKMGDRRIGSGAGLPRLSPRPHPQRQPRVSARSSTTRAPRCCTCCGASSATRPFFRGLRRFYVGVAVHEGRHRGFPRRDGSRSRPAARALLRALDLRRRRCRASRSRYRVERARTAGGRAALRTGGRHLRRAGHGHASVRRPTRGPDVLVPVTDRTVEMRVPLSGRRSAACRDQQGRRHAARSKSSERNLAVRRRAMI